MNTRSSTRAPSDLTSEYDEAPAGAAGEATNPFSASISAASSAAVAIAGDREIGEVQAAMTIAKRFPRDPRVAMDRILMACARQALAESALYSYARGGQEVTGPSIRLAEALAQAWGNLQVGVRELEQRDGESTVEAYAWDLETNVRQAKVFQVAHERHTRAGARRLTDPRDIYEIVANQGARRLRACILAAIPGDVTEAAVRQCEVTLKTKAEVTPDRLRSLVERFAEFHVTREQIEQRIQRRIEAITPALMLQLGKVYNSIKDGMSAPTEWFDLGAAGADAASLSPAERVRAARAGAPDAVPHFDAASGVAAIKACTSIAELVAKWREIRQDFEATHRALPIEIEAAHNELRESLADRETNRQS
jgi:hypothetical protein